MEKEMLSGKLYKLLACPVCKAHLHYSKNKLVCNVCEQEYNIKDNIPQMLISKKKK